MYGLPPAGVITDPPMHPYYNPSMYMQLVHIRTYSYVQLVFEPVLLTQQKDSYYCITD